MKRLVWLSLGAAGGIVAYRKGSALIAQAREQGFMVTSSQLVTTSKAAIEQAQQVIQRGLGGESRGLR